MPTQLLPNLKPFGYNGKRSGERTVPCSSEHPGSWEYRSLGSWAEPRWVKSPVSSHHHIVLESEACFCKAVCWLVTKTLPRYPQLRPLVIFTWASRGDLTWLKSNRVKAQKMFEKNILINSKFFVVFCCCSASCDLGNNRCFRYHMHVFNMFWHFGSF